MTRIEDMSDMERQSWITLLADTAVFAYFIRKMTHSAGVEQFSPTGLIHIFITVIVMTVILHAVINAVFAIRLKKTEHEVDERDREIEAKGDRISGYFLYAAISVIIFQLLMEYTWPAPEQYDPPVSVMTPPSMFFALMATLFIGDILKRATMVWKYRG